MVCKNRFEEFIMKVAEKVNINDSDRVLFTDDFNAIRDFLMNAMKENPVFNAVFGGCSLTGSYLDGLKINYPDEFDIHVKIALPYRQYIRAKADAQRPGFIRLNFEEVLKNLSNGNQAELRIYNVFRQFFGKEEKYLKRNRFNNWFHELFESVFQKYGNQFGEYNLIGSSRGIAYTVYAKSPERVMGIDFVAAFEFDKSDWLALRSFPSQVKSVPWFAVPKPTVGPGSSRLYAFSICAPQIEKELIWNKNHLKSSLRLLKSLILKKSLIHVKSYYIKTVYLWECERVSNSFWDQPIADILIHMLERLVHYFTEGNLPFYWDQRLNLFEILPPSEQINYKECLRQTLDVFERFRYSEEYKGEKLTYKMVAKHFCKKNRAQ